jgi:hypothetical protein
MVTETDITVRTINNESFGYNISPTALISELKELLKDSTTIDISRQRLIFRGRVLQDNLRLTDYLINGGHVLHMVARPTNYTELLAESHRNPEHLIQNIAIPSNQSRVTQGLNENELELFNQLMGGESQGQISQQQTYSSDISSHSFQSPSRFAVIPSTTAHIASFATASANAVPHSSANRSLDSVERIRQGLLTMRTIISTMEIALFPNNTAPIAGTSSTTTADSPSVTAAKLESNITDQKCLDNQIIGTSSNSKISKSSPSRIPKRAKDNLTAVTGGGNSSNSTSDSSFFSFMSETRGVTDPIDSSADHLDNVSNRKEAAKLSGVEDEGKKESATRQTSQRIEQERQRTFFVGQWIDVKDTVSQWLEATVTLLDQEGQRLFVHYNGW